MSGTHRLIKLAFLTFVEINLDVNWIAISNNVRSPDAAVPRFCCDVRTCLGTRRTGGRGQLERGEIGRAGGHGTDRVSVMSSVFWSAMMRRELKGWVGVGVGVGGWVRWVSGC